MLIDNEIKLDFKDVLIRPKRSKLTSRSQVDLIRNIKFKHNKDYTWCGIPIMVSNMDTTGTFDMAFSLSKEKLKLDEWRDFYIKTTNMGLSNNYIFDYISATSGIGEKDLEKLDQIMKEIPIKFISLDVANGYTDKFVDIVENTRLKYPKKIIIAGTVVVPDAIYWT